MYPSIQQADTYVENFEASNIQDTNELDSLLLSVQSLVALDYEPLEASIEHALGHGTHRVSTLIFGSALSHELITDLYSGLAQILVQIGSIQTKKVGHTLALLRTFGLGLFFSWPLLELEFTEMHDGSSDLVHILLLFGSESQYIEGDLWFNCG